MTIIPISPAPTAVGFTCVALPGDFADRVRTTLRDDFNRQVRVTVARGGEPLRDQLRRASEGERLILCSYQSVPLPSPFAEIGPIFISADHDRTPEIEAAGLPAGYFPKAFALRSYDDQDCIIESGIVEPAAAPHRIREFLALPATAYVHARFAGHGCFACRFDRA